MTRLELPYPPLLNRLYKTGKGRFYKDTRAKRYTSQVQLHCLSKQVKPIAGPIRMTLMLYQTRESDIDAPLKCLLDAMKGRVYFDDRQIKDLHIIIWEHGIKKSHVVVEAEALHLQFRRELMREAEDAT